MRYKYYIIILGLVISDMYSMEYPYKTRVILEENNRFKLELEESTPLPIIILEGCAFCNNEPTAVISNQSVVCKQCNGTTYCSVECRGLHQETHQKDCLRIQQAHYGDLNRIEDFKQANIALFKKTKIMRYFKEATKWHCRKVLRLMQDSECSTEPDIKIKIDKKQQEDADLFDILKAKVQENEEYTAERLKKEIIDELHEASYWAEALIKKNSLVSPDGILRYSNYYFYSEGLIPPKPMVLSKQYTSNMRLKALEEYKEWHRETQIQEIRNKELYRKELNDDLLIKE